MSPNWEWKQFCGQNESFQMWNGYSFGQCFVQVAFVAPTHAIFMILSAYYFAVLSLRYTNVIENSSASPCKIWTCFIRYALCVLFIITWIVKLCFMISLKSNFPYNGLVFLAVCVIALLTWMLHCMMTWKLKRNPFYGSRGPLLIFLAYVLLLLSCAMQVYSIVDVHLRKPSALNVVEIITCLQGGLHILFLFSLIPNGKVLQQGEFSIQNGRIERNRLLSDSGIRGYGAVSRPSNDLGVAEDTANCLSKLSFWWVQPLMLKGTKGQLSYSSDLFLLPKRLGTDSIEYKFNCNFRELEEVEDFTADFENCVPDVNFSDISNNVPCNNVRMHNSRKNRGEVTLLKALHKTFGTEYYLLGILKLMSDAIGFAGPLLLNLLVSFMENQTEPMYNGYIYAGSLFISTFIGALLSTQFNYHVQVVGLKLRAAIITTIYRKSLQVNTVSMSGFTTGEVVNFMSTDTDRIVNFCPSFHQFWSLPFQIAVSLFLLHQQVGLAFLAGLGFALLLIPINRWLAIKIGKLSTAMMAQKDGRVKVMNEILAGIRVIKLYAWEDHFAEKIKTLRNAELKSLKGRKYLDAMCVYFWATTPVLIAILTFTTYSLMGHQLTAAKVFTSLALFTMLISPLNAFPWVLNGLMEAWVSVKRVQAFMQLKELNLDGYYTKHSGHERDAMQILQGNFSWGSDEKESTADREPQQDSIQKHSKTLRLTDINISILKGQLVGIVGKVGCGKSSLLNAILAEMHRDGGSIAVASLSHGFGLVSQEAWIQHATMKDNILFGKPFNARKYASVIAACALEEDLKILPAGDCTEIGENGVTLSGGQKARVALARAVYQDKDFYLLDDPLAAVDAHVASHLFFKCILGLLRNKTRLLCTHHTKYLQHADIVIVMEEGRVVNIGHPVDILDQLDLELVQEEVQDKESAGDQSSSVCSTVDGALVQEEEKDTGIVKFHVYQAYWKAVGHCLAPLILISLFLMQGSRNINDWWLSYWISHSHPNVTVDNSSQPPGHSEVQGYSYTTVPSTVNDSVLRYAEDNVSYYLTVYGILAGANSLFTLARAFLFAYGGICAAMTIHKKLLSSILQASVSFFDVTPIGRVVNRFSSDVYCIDDSLPFMMNILLAQFYGVLGTVAITCYGLPWFMVLLVPLTIIYYFIQSYYRQTSREIKRITSVTLSPIYAHFSESITGLTTIRALRECARFKKENEVRLEENQQAQFAGIVAGQWLQIRLQMLGVVMVTGVAFIAVLEHHFQTVDPGLVGLAISYALSITNLLSGVVTAFTETEKQMVSVERGMQYIEDVPSEKQEGILDPPPYWPIQGSLCFEQVYLQYRPGLPYALNGVTFETQPAEKIGIVGRTGSGKSSLFLAMFRMVEISQGQITIDGIGIKHVSLKILRSNLAVIPQDPFLFSGSVRENLDPTQSCSTSELWTVLKRCHVDKAVEKMGGLEAEVEEKGRLFSVGQRQLLCLARALLTRAKILCIDEATASVDAETDRMVQETIRDEFSDNTVLTIAHRINTVLNSDRVMVMNNGKIGEFESPKALLENPHSLFYGLVHGNQTSRGGENAF
ncbi:multidrug resistance-associated protein 7 [Lingula anatina]|uniref:ABC-type xenobiotic transporter n=1 Tax=Lingula anatina TaxID=7574 RepID=A0A1S3ISY9_LINAN|nr:multidrug resistance-associated protein 7 [Lingula anatina]|eukprot:XP_013401317.1 multidrug resistance-associated protein 7 [Lingula anatina]